MLDNGSTGNLGLLTSGIDYGIVEALLLFVYLLLFIMIIIIIILLVWVNLFCPSWCSMQLYTGKWEVMKLENPEEKIKKVILVA